MSDVKGSAVDTIAFIDLRAQRAALREKIDAAIDRVLDHGQFILGPEVASLEAELGAWCGASEVIACANGTDALVIVLMAKEVGPGDAVLCPSFTFAATAEAVVLVGATPVFVDVLPDTFNMCPSSLKKGIATAKRLDLRPVGVIPVDLFGQPGDYDLLEPICRANGLWMLADAAQSFGASYKGRRVGKFGMATTTSFFPAKPLGCYGDGGAVFTDDAELAGILRSLRVHGQGSDKYDNVRIGLNSRLDTIQASVLREKFRVFSDELASRNAISARYARSLADVAIVPQVMNGCVSTWAQYTIRVPAGTRDALRRALSEKKVPTAVYYPIPLHRQTAYRAYPIAGNGLPVSDKLAAEVVSLPMHPYLAPNVQQYIIAAAQEALRPRRGERHHATSA